MDAATTTRGLKYFNILKCCSWIQNKENYRTRGDPLIPPIPALPPFICPNINYSRPPINVFSISALHAQSWMALPVQKRAWATDTELENPLVWGKQKGVYSSYSVLMINSIGLVYLKLWGLNRRFRVPWSFETVYSAPFGLYSGRGKQLGL